MTETHRFRRRQNRRHTAVHEAGYAVYFIIALLVCYAQPCNSEVTFDFAKAPTVPYFSKAGHAYAVRHHLPKAPFQRSSHDLVDPPRDVPARSWEGSFCARWTDECDVCDRNEKTKAVTYQPAQGIMLYQEHTLPYALWHPQRIDGDGSACIKRNVKCTETLPLEQLAAVCSYTSSNLVQRRAGQSDETIFSTESSEIWYFSRRSKRWNLMSTSQGDIPGKISDKDIQYRGFDERCKKAIGDDLLYDPVIER